MGSIGLASEDVYMLHAAGIARQKLQEVWRLPRHVPAASPFRVGV